MTYDRYFFVLVFEHQYQYHARFLELLLITGCRTLLMRGQTASPPLLTYGHVPKAPLLLLFDVGHQPWFCFSLPSVTISTHPVFAMIELSIYKILNDVHAHLHNTLAPRSPSKRNPQWTGPPFNAYRLLCSSKPPACPPQSSKPQMKHHRPSIPSA